MRGTRAAPIPLPCRRHRRGPRLRCHGNACTTQPGPRRPVTGTSRSLSARSEAEGLRTRRPWSVGSTSIIRADATAGRSRRPRQGGRDRRRRRLGVRPPRGACGDGDANRLVERREASRVGRAALAGEARPSRRPHARAGHARVRGRHRSLELATADLSLTRDGTLGNRSRPPTRSTPMAPAGEKALSQPAPVRRQKAQGSAESDRAQRSAAPQGRRPTGAMARLGGADARAAPTVWR